MNIIDTMNMVVTVDEVQFSKLAQFIVSDENLTGAKFGSYSREKQFATIRKCHREEGSLVVTLECVIGFYTEKNNTHSDDKYKVPNRCILGLMQSMGLFPETVS